MQNLSFLFLNLMISLTVYLFYSGYNGKYPLLLFGLSIIVSVLIWYASNHDRTIISIRDESPEGNQINIKISQLFYYAFLIVLVAITLQTEGEYYKAQTLIDNTFIYESIKNFNGTVLYI